ncbi:DNA polymerase III subunit gamma/tau [Phocicoccus pinnipedialis]|uniref:DNA-directed DNA polymerase n=1 Tax=Phocicoccus pinnipedialis TaxID=110845 RepID=A0A6V7R497_9BACL|nr:DNA polymerase III subunit gamma/tau [Jeotgalicoccus pinnipedialis]MBP1939627.1 DNA polymerase-3 subunit gamma/tau [Jeotgalicoccus pinnipedialis]CAD2072249.1 DNA polymerase III subunit tau [Jeotgalicoccus pinnipedialis]
MEYQALYRAFRPQSFGEVVGQKHITQTLRNAIKRGKESHAYLFSGPRGTGKTSIAKIFAKALNCPNGLDGEPCNECHLCQTITDGSANDVIEIDAASNNGVDEIRNIRDRVKYAPSEAKFKVYIIDEVHMLTTGAFNALLKTLEEPPVHAIFILATTEPHKIPATIISRTQRFDFKAIELNEIVEHLKYVAENQSIEYEHEAIEYIARAAEGGMRDALSIFDQVIAYSGDKITLDDAVIITGGIKTEDLNEWMKLVETQNTKDAFLKYHQFIDEGKDPVRLVHELLYFLRDVILMKHSNQVDDNTAFVTLDDSVIYDLIEILNDSMVMMRYSVNVSVHLEVVIVKMVQALNKTEASTSSVSSDEIRRLESQIRALEAKLEDGKFTRPERKRPEKVRRNRNVFSVEKIKEVLDRANREDLEKLKAEWPNVYRKIEEMDNQPLRALVKESEPVAASETQVLIMFQSDVHSELINNDDEKKKELENLIPSIIGKEVRVVGVPESNWQQVRQEYIDKRRQGVKEEKKPSDVAKEIFDSSIIEIKE